MEDDRDLLGKADALLRRHVPPRADAGEGADKGATGRPVALLANFLTRRSA